MPQIKKAVLFLKQLWQTNSWFRGGVQWSLVAIPFYLMGQNLYQNWQLVQQHSWSVEPLSLTLSILFLLGAFLLLPMSMRYSMLMLNHDLPYRVTYRAYFLSQMAKYIPGGIWIVPGRILVLKQVGVAGTVGSLGMLVELYVLVVTGLLMCLPYLLMQAVVPIWFIALLFVGLIFSLMLFYTPLLPWLFRRVAWLSSVTFRVDRYLLSLTAVSFAFWLLLGTGFFWLVRSLEGISLELWLILISAYSMAWVAGFLIFLTPGGLGVREAILTLLLAPFLPLPIATMIALMARVWWLIAETTCVIIATLLPVAPSLDE